MRPLRVTNIQRGCVYDGPGVRTTVFLKGCPLRCPWCCNPETQSFEQELFIDDEKCLYNKGISSRLCAECIRLGGTRYVDECPLGVAEKVSYDYSTEELHSTLLKDKSLYERANGGVTFSGGEPLLYANQLIPLLDILNREGISIAIETTLVSSKKVVETVVQYIQCWIIDLKLQPQLLLYDTEYLNQLKDNLFFLSGKDTVFRLVFVDEMLPEKETVLKRLVFFKIFEVELLLCHNLGQKKYVRLGRESKNYSASKDKAVVFLDYLNKNKIKSILLTI